MFDSPKSPFWDLEEVWMVVRRFRRVRTDFGGRVDDRRRVVGTSGGRVGRAGGREDGIEVGVGVRFVEAPGGSPPKVPFLDLEEIWTVVRRYGRMWADFALSATALNGVR